ASATPSVDLPDPAGPITTRTKGRQRCLIGKPLIQLRSYRGSAQGERRSSAEAGSSYTSRNPFPGDPSAVSSSRTVSARGREAGQSLRLLVKKKVRPSGEKRGPKSQPGEFTPAPSARGSVHRAPHRKVTNRSYSPRPSRRPLPAKISIRPSAEIHGSISWSGVLIGSPRFSGAAKWSPSHRACQRSHLPLPPGRSAPKNSLPSSVIV